jgi:tRNA (cytidine/uridine-2'-O-)-methyltransferase
MIILSKPDAQGRKPGTETVMRLALYQPDIPQNTGTLLRTAACLEWPVDLIEPAGFQLADNRFRRALMDYGERLQMTRHASWADFRNARSGDRLVLLTTRADVALWQVAFRPGDILLLGRESAGVPEDVHEAADIRAGIPMAPGARSLNVAVAGAMAMGEALRQTGFPAMSDGR